MRLNWNKNYQDFSDEKWWNELIELKEKEKKISWGNLEQEQIEILLNYAEELVEVMFYYVIKQDMKNLEYFMRRYDAILQILDKSGLSNTGYWYLKMEFSHLNGLLYRGVGKNRKASENFEEFLEFSKKCMLAMKKDRQLQDEQRLFLIWRSITGDKIAKDIFDILKNYDNVKYVMSKMLEELADIVSYLKYAPGIAVQVADFYATFAATYYLQNARNEGVIYYQKSIDIFSLFTDDNYEWKRIWTLGQYSLMELNYAGNYEPMLEIEKEIVQYQKREYLQEYEKGVVEGTLGLILFQKCIQFQQKEDAVKALFFAEDSCDKLDVALGILDKSCQNKNYDDYTRSILCEMAGKIYGAYIGALDLLGVLYFCNKQFQDAEGIFLKLMTFLVEDNKYKVPDTVTMMIRAEIAEYLTIITGDRGEIDKAEFYGTMAADTAVLLLDNQKTEAICGIAVSSCALVADLCLKIKKKQKSARYAEKGIQACDFLQEISPKHGKLQMRGQLIKIQKRASRKFF